ncbi:MAG: HYR domain-containing protein, partial [Saprospiraceae bacterium]|nr:HYR domain-containing protein [Saprospiraceae bacterium]
MKKLSIIFVLFFLCSLSASAQKEKTNNVAKHSTISSLNQFIKNNQKDYIITSEHISSTSGIKHTYIRQAINGLEVVGTESSLHLDSRNNVIAQNIKIIENIEATIRSSTPSLSARLAIQSVAGKMGYTVKDLKQIGPPEGVSQKSQFNDGGISRRDIPVRLMYLFSKESGSRLVWELSIEEINSTDFWNFYVDAVSGDILRKDNWTAQCNILEAHVHNEEKSPSEIVFPNLNTNSFVFNAADGIGSYKVFAMPLETANHGPRTLEVNPENALASPFGWHDTDGITGAEYTVTQGNNVRAYRLSDDFLPDGGTDLLFDFALDTSVSPTTETATIRNVSSSITNLFYWNNIIHDVIYQYGFDEASGNFQENNYGNGGAGSDSVNAHAQLDDLCNAFFSTPADGSNPTMLMYYGCNSTNRDGSLDNFVVIHEYAHGISNRLTGGAAAANCLINNEQMGEGWSDYYAIMLTMTNSDLAADARGVGTYLIGENPTDSGIRPTPYSTDFAVNSSTYNTIKSVSVPHGVGYVWATMLWEMTWDLIDVYGFDPDFYNGTGGNNIALALVTEALKLQPCSPGFIDGRDAILAADQTLYGGENQCLIWGSFTRRGLGINASQGSSGSRSDGIEDFTSPVPSFTLSLDSICNSDGIQTLSGGSTLKAGSYMGPGVSDNGDGTFDFDPNLAGPGIHTITYTTTDCSGTTVTPTDEITVSDGDPILECIDATLTLDASGDATLTNADVLDNLTPGTGYSVVESGTFLPDDISAIYTEVALGDDDGIGVPLGFPFSFFETEYTTVYIASNGYLTFTNAGLNVWQNTAMGNAAAPNNAIAVMWDDLRPDTGSTISYATIGTAPNRRFVVSYDNIRHYTPSDTGSQNTFQVKLFEGTGVIEIHSAIITSDGGTRTQGIENATASEFYATSGRNNTDWTATNDFKAFVPNTGGLPDNCGNAVTISLSQTTFTCDDIGENVVTVTANDGAGGVSTCDVTVTVTDPLSTCNLPPTAVCQNIVVNDDGDCQETVAASDFDGGSSDPEDGIALIYSVSPAGPYPLGITNVVLTVEDSGGLTDTCNATITVLDVTPPEMFCPTDIEVGTDPGQCDAIVNFSYTSSDCDGATLTASPDTGSVFPVGTTLVTVTATDGSGNTNTCTFNVTVNDTEAPNIICPPDVTLECGQSTDPANTGTAIGTDNCPGVTVSTSDNIIPGACTNEFIIERTWTATDGAGNTNSCVQNIQVIDNQAPTPPAAPADLTLQCGDDVSAPVALTATDNCDGNITVSPTTQTTPGNCPNDFVMVRTWTFTDSCGNTSSVSQTIIVSDTTAPAAPAPPADLNLECAQDVPPPVDLTATDNCDGPITASPTVSVIPGACLNDFTMVRTWTFSDVCGNTSSVSQVITVLDNTAPVAPAPPADLNLECAQDVPPPVDLTATD